MRHSLRVRLPLLISGLVAISLVVFLAVSYQQVQRELLRAGETRALAASEQLASLLARSAQARLTDVRRAAQDPLLLAALEAPDEARVAEAARVRLAALAGAGQPPPELWNAAGRRLLVAARGTSAPPAEAVPPVPAPVREGISGFGAGASAVYWDATAAIGSNAGESAERAPRGFVVSRRVLTRAGVEGVSRLVGARANIILGSPAGGVWSDLAAPVPTPAYAVEPGLIRTGRDGEGSVGSAAAVAGTPWLVLVQFRRADIVAPARSYLTRMLIVAAVLVALSGLMAHRISARITRPLHQLTASAEAIARGHFEIPPASHRRDEIGRLSVAFQTMSAEVQAWRQQLEARVAERTRDVVALNTQLAGRVDELKALTSELESFSYSVSHDLRAPLRHVGGFAALLESSSAPALGEQGRRYLRTISEAAARMGRLIDDLLSFSRMGRAEMLRTRVDLGALVADVRAEVQQERPDADIIWTVHPLPVAEGDPAMLRLVFHNLLSNAVKYSATRIPAAIEIGTTESADETIVFVRDNGVGFDMQHATNLFGVFQRLHSAEAFEGTGIGLATVRRILSRHGGRAWAESAPNAGATFFIALPAPAMAVQSNEPAYQNVRQG